MFLCPHTSTPLRRAFARGVFVWVSPNSGGRLITLAALRQILGEDAPRELWARALIIKDPGGLRCPSCAKGMREVTAPEWAGAHEVDVCTRCRLVWLDSREFPEVPSHRDLLTPTADASLIKEIAQSQAEVLLAQDRRDNPPIIGAGPDSWLKTVPGLIGLPVEMGGHTYDRLPWVTWVLGLLMLGIHVFGTGNDSAFLLDWALIPAQPWRHWGATMLTWGLVHAGWLHLLGNLYFFGVFADDVEGYYGPWRTLVLIFGTLFISASILVLGDAPAAHPHVGISGAITALMVNYGLIYRKSRIAFFLPYLHRNRHGGFYRALGWIRIAAFWAILGFVAKDLLYFMTYEATGMTNVSHSGHLLGGLCGFGFWLLNGRPNWYYDSVPAHPSGLQQRLLVPYD